MPSNTTSHMFFYVYVLQSEKDGKRYIGFTNDLKKRIKEHESGKNFSTKSRLPINLISYEACLNKDDAKRWEKYLKSTQRRRFLGLRLIKYSNQMKNFSNGRMMY